MKKAGCKQVFTDKAGGNRIERKGLAEALSHLRENDALVVWKLDRLGRTVRGFVDLVGELEHRRVHFQSLTNRINTKTPGRSLLLPRDGQLGANETWLSR